MARQVKINCLIYTMKVLLISKDAWTGGAAVAARRLMESLRERKVEVKMLVQENGDTEQGIHDTTHGLFKHSTNTIRFILERLTFLPHEKSRTVRFMFSPANMGEDLSGHPLVQEADILHLHWVNGGFLSLRALDKLFSLGKPVVWTFHDMWSMTGGCHSALECTNYMRSCGDCPYLRRPGKGDLSHRGWKRKKELFSRYRFTIVTPSRWLSNCVTSSSLLGQYEVRAIPNLVDSGNFHPVDREEACRNLGLDPGKRYILFGASNIRNMIKGFDYFVEAIRILHEQMKGEDNVEVLLLGRNRGDEGALIPFPSRTIAFTGSSRTLAEVFSVAHVFVISSLLENYPNTIAEAMLCGTPAVGFRNGGIPEMIAHMKDGYLADHRSAPDLAAGMNWILTHPEYESVSELARSGALERFSPGRSLEGYLSLYRSLVEKQER
jgi:glycosyltransferase involved in cell wall biosynthesis